MQAYIDDSMADGRALVFGGLIASSERWEAFSIAWQRCLDDAPWDVFKMKNVSHRCTGKRLEHARRHYRTMREHVHGAICFVVPLEPLARVTAQYELTATLAGKPYYWASKGIINGLAQNQKAWGLKEPVDFIFDERPEEEKVTIRYGWEIYLRTIPDDISSVTGKPPVSADDKSVLPLQAADMWAWSCRKQWLENDGLIPQNSYPIPWGSVGDIPQMVLQWTEGDIEQEISKIAAAIERPFPSA